MYLLISPINKGTKGAVSGAIPGAAFLFSCRIAFILSCFPAFFIADEKNEPIRAVVYCEMPEVKDILQDFWKNWRTDKRCAGIDI